METHIDAIRAAVANNATPEARAAGAQACRTLLAALEATPGQPIEAAPQPGAPLQAIVAALRGMPPEQVLDVAIARLKAALPADTAVEAMPRFNVQLVGVPKIGGGQ